jgi:hypothetical protein
MIGRLEIRSAAGGIAVCFVNGVAVAGRGGGRKGWHVGWALRQKAMI